MNELTISELVKRTGIPSSTISYYEHEGLISSRAHKGFQRVFDLQAVDQLLLICLGKQVGLSLNELQNMLSHHRQNEGQKKLDSRINEIDSQIKQLDILRESLRHIHQCEYDNPLACPIFQKLLQAAAFEPSKK